MIFINPKTDFAFKKIFGSAESKDILKSFLNALLYQAKPVIDDLEIIDPYLAPKIRGVKDTYLDVKAKINGNKTAIVEMNVLNVESFEKRILYHAAKAYSAQLNQGDQYDLLNPVIFLVITDFEIFENHGEVISRFGLKEKTSLVDYLTNDLELVFVELPKFYKTLDELETLGEKWIYFMKTDRIFRSVPKQLSDVPEICQAFAIANEANIETEELRDLERREIFIQDQNGLIARATRLGIQQGIIRGIEQGNVKLISRQLKRRFGVLSPLTQTRIAELSPLELENLGEALLDFGSMSDLKSWLQARHNRQ